MDSALEGIIDFFRVRQLNIVAVAILTISYLVYQRCWGTKNEIDEDGYNRRSRSHSRSGSHCRTRSPSAYKQYYSPSKPRRGRRQTHRRCPDCSSVDSYDD